jgi:MerR family mercuric resistance operon transcriptional regulator
MDGGFTIGRLAGEAGIPVSSVRYYERRGLIRPDGRAGTGRYRVYGAGVLERLRFIRAAQAAGFTLTDIAVLLEFRDGDLTPCEEVQGLIARRLRRVERDIEHLEHVRGVLRRWLGVCQRSARSGRCGVLAGLERPGACEQGADKVEKASRKRKKA